MYPAPATKASGAGDEAGVARFSDIRADEGRHRYAFHSGLKQSDKSMES